MQMRPTTALVLRTQPGVPAAPSVALLAAQKLGLRAAVIEFDPVYVDVICQRFYDTTGETPTHADTGDAFPLKEKSGAS